MSWRWAKALPLLASEVAKRLTSDVEDAGEDHTITKTIDVQHVALGNPRKSSAILGELGA